MGEKAGKALHTTFSKKEFQPQNQQSQHLGVLHATMPHRFLACLWRQGVAKEDLNFLLLLLLVVVVVVVEM